MVIITIKFIIIIIIKITGRGKETSGFFVAVLGGIVVGTIAYDRKVIIVIAHTIIIIVIQLLEFPIPATTTTTPATTTSQKATQAWYHRSAGVKTTGKTLNKKIQKKILKNE